MEPGFPRNLENSESLYNSTIQIIHEFNNSNIRNIRLLVLVLDCWYWCWTIGIGIGVRLPVLALVLVLDYRYWAISIGIGIGIPGATVLEQKVLDPRRGPRRGPRGIH